MGKIRRQRKKLHLSNDNRSVQAVSNWRDTSVSEVNNSFPSEAFNNIFDGIDIPFSSHSLRDDDTRTVISTSKSVYKEKVASKEERRKLRHQTFIERINAIEAMKRAKKNKKKPQVVNLLETSDYVRPQECEKPKKMKKKGTMKSAMRHKQMLKDIAAIKKVWKNPDFKVDPVATVSDLVQKKISEEL